MPTPTDRKCPCCHNSTMHMYVGWAKSVVYRCKACGYTVAGTAEEAERQVVGVVTLRVRE